MFKLSSTTVQSFNLFFRCIEIERCMNTNGWSLFLHGALSNFRKGHPEGTVESDGHIVVLVFAAMF